MDHFEGKNPLQHVLDARKKGFLASQETHGAELSGSFLAAVDAAKETTFLLLIFQAVSIPFLIAFAIWKTARSALLGFSRLERFHRVIQEERFEIEHHRLQEKEELRALYEAKGLSGKLLDEAVDVFMADDNRLLELMLEEEFGFRLESYEHPLEQALGALSAVLVTGAFFWVGFAFLPSAWVIALGFLIVGALSAIAAKRQKNAPLDAFVWNTSALALALLAFYFLKSAL